MAEPFAVSVVIPALNEAERIGNAIAAIRAQSEPPLEIVVVDDGSRDETAAVARRLGARVYVHERNLGLAAARNTGILGSSGTWLAFCDADDAWRPEMLELARRAHEARPDVDFMFADHRVEIDGRITLASMFAACPEFRAAGGVRVAPDIVYFERQPLAHALAERNFAAPSTVVVRRAFLQRNGLHFAPGLPSNAELHVAEDIEWYLRVLRASDALAIDRVMLTYHRHAGSLSENPGRVNYGNVRLGEIIAENPERYAPGLAATYRKQRRQHVRRAARDDVRTFRFESARAKLREAQQIEFHAADAALSLLTRLAEVPGGLWLANAVRTAWRVALGPALRAIGRS